MRRLLLVLAVSLVMAAVMVAMAVPAFANKGGLPSDKVNNNACLGQSIRGGIMVNGKTPPERAEEANLVFGIENAGDYNKFIKSSPIFCNTPF